MNHDGIFYCFFGTKQEAEIARKIQVLLWRLEKNGFYLKRDQRSLKELNLYNIYLQYDESHLKTSAKQPKTTTCIAIVTKNSFADSILKRIVQFVEEVINYSNFSSSYTTKNKYRIPLTSEILGQLQEQIKAEQAYQALNLFRKTPQASPIDPPYDVVPNENRVQFFINKNKEYERKYNLRQEALLITAREIAPNLSPRELLNIKNFADDRSTLSPEINKSKFIKRVLTYHSEHTGNNNAPLESKDHAVTIGVGKPF